MKKIHYVLGVCAIIIVIGIFFLLNKPDDTMGAQILPRTFTDLIGTRTASTTVAVGWYGNYAASTTYPINLLKASEATLVFDTVSASTSAGAYFSILGSNDPGCETATTTTIYNLLTKAQVRWFDAGQFLDEATVISSFVNSTTTIGWANPQKIQRALHFTKLNIECLAVEVNASSTEIYGQYRLKD